MTNKLQEFMKKVGKLNKNDYSIEILRTKKKSEYSVIFHIIFIDYDEKLKVYRDYKNRDRVDNLKEWLEEECTQYEPKAHDKCIYYFDADSFIVDIEYTSYWYE